MLADRRLPNGKLRRVVTTSRLRSVHSPGNSKRAPGKGARAGDERELVHRCGKGKERSRVEQIDRGRTGACGTHGRKGRAMKTYSRKKGDSPSNVIIHVNELCRLCLAKEEEMVPIYDDETVPMPLRILSCVNIEVGRTVPTPSRADERDAGGRRARDHVAGASRASIRGRR